MKIEIKSRFDYLCDNCDVLDDAVTSSKNESCEHCKDRIVYIRDCVWGEGKSRAVTSVYNKDEHSYVEKILSSLDDSKVDLGGYIVIKCDGINMAFSIIQILMDQDYCGCFRLDSLHDMILVKDVLAVTFDCESG